MRRTLALALLLVVACEARQRGGAANVKGSVALQSSAVPSPSFELSVIPRFFATNELFGDPVQQGDAFDASSLKYAGYEVGMPPAGRTYTLSGCYVALRSTGVVRLPREQTRVAAGNDVTLVGGFGYRQAGLWLPGEYELRCRTEGFEVEPRRFRVTGRAQGAPGTTMIPNRTILEKGTVERISFMEHPYDPPPVGQRRFYGSFRGARYIGPEVKLKLEPLPTPRRFRFRCHWFNDRGDVIGSDFRDVQVPPGETDYYLWLSWGNRQGTFWQPGTYAVECDADDVLLATGYFAVL